jgi:hypothetical protein
MDGWEIANLVALAFVCGAGIGAALYRRADRRIRGIAARRAQEEFLATRWETPAEAIARHARYVEAEKELAEALAPQIRRLPHGH